MPRNYLRPRQHNTRNVTSPFGVEHSSAQWPERFWRYETAWEDNIITVNISHTTFRSSETRQINLGEIVMDVRGGRSPYRKMKRLRDFPRLLKAVKIGINTVLARNDDGDAWQQVGMFLWNCIRFFVWCIRKGIHKLSDLTPEDVTSCVASVGKKGWWGVLGYDSALRALLKRAKADHAFAISLKGTSDHVPYTTFNHTRISAQIGLPLPRSALPDWFSRAMCKIYDDKRKQPARLSQRLVDTGSLIRTLNLLALFPPYADSIPFFPFQNAEAAKRRYQKVHSLRANYDGRTLNLPLPQAISLLETSLKWAFDYFPGVTELVQIVLNAFKKNRNKNADECDAAMRTALRNAYPAIREKYQLPFPEIDMNHGNQSLHAMVGYVMTAITCLIALNHGRRRNEILGHEKIYGLYVGCVQEVAPESDNKKIDIYIEKSLRNYATLWCNILVQRCVEKLETLHTLFNRFKPSSRATNRRPSSSAGGNAKLSREERLKIKRAQKLFTLVNFSKRGLTGGNTEYNWDNYAPEFFTMAGVDVRDFAARTHPFRRLFAVLFVYRYDCPELLALSQHFFHLTVDQTRIYVTDSKSRVQKNRIAELFAKGREDQKNLQELLSETRTRFLAEKIEDLLNGKLLGGAFPRVVLRFVKQLSKFSDFLELTNEEKARLITERLEHIGYKVSEKENGACMAGDARRGRQNANCARDGDIHPETASPKRCQKCTFSLTTSTTILWFEKDRDEARACADNLRLAPSIRIGYQRQADQMDAIIALEKQFSEETANQYQAVEATWPLTQAAA
ncbi:hypothetical protein PQQ51_19545 [Paraburkholderia xenovorans]|uniref:hypothetical protein n=1 Tax=Paraburkholderia xenovorans TaxID=36873 RepID=UPI0038BB14EC